jgi:hypothetical protein
MFQKFLLAVIQTGVAEPEPARSRIIIVEPEL